MLHVFPNANMCILSFKNEYNYVQVALLLLDAAVSSFNSTIRQVCNQPARSTQPSTLCGTVK